jgi:hypothetical protein
MMRAVLDTSVVIAHDVPPLDGELLIAATAHAHDALPYTRNGGDLRRLADHIEIVPV